MVNGSANMADVQLWMQEGPQLLESGCVNPPLDVMGTSHENAELNSGRRTMHFADHPMDIFQYPIYLSDPMSYATTFVENYAPYQPESIHLSNGSPDCTVPNHHNQPLASTSTSASGLSHSYKEGEDANSNRAEVMKRRMRLVSIPSLLEIFC